MWVMLLNDMRSPNIERLTPVCRAETKEMLMDFLTRESVPGYRDGQWGKSFRQGGPLEWFNPPYKNDENMHFQNAGGVEKWIENARRDYEDRVMSLPVF